MENDRAPSVFDSLNAREFLRDYLDWAKDNRIGLTHRLVLKKLGVTSSGFLANFLSGKSNLNPAQAKALGGVLGFPPADARFFETLVTFTQARGIEEKGDALDSMRAQVRSRDRKLDPRQYSLFSKWVYPLVFELVALMPVTDNHREVCSLLDGSVKPEDVRKALEVLESLELIRRNGNGVYEQSQATLKTGDEIASTDVVKYQQSILKKAIEALDKVSLEDRSITATTLPLSLEVLERVKQESRIFRDKLLRISEEDAGADRVYFLSLNLFPGTKPVHRDEV